MLLLADDTSPRLAWMAHWLGVQLTGRALPVLRTAESLPANAAVIAYTAQKPPITCLHIEPQGLLHQSGLQQQPMGGGSWMGMPTLFTQSNGNLPFDVLAAAFYLLQRYEEYAANTPKDAYGRYHHIHSLAFKSGFLNRPLVDEWVEAIRQQLQALFPGSVMPPPPFLPQATYDVDLAWSYRHKHWLRQAWGCCRDLIQPRALAHRWQVWRGRQPDPYDVFTELEALHRQQNLQPLWFWLLAAQHRGYDRNIAPNHPALHALMRRLATPNNMGIHLSWHAAESPAAMEAECLRFEQILGYQPTINRFHYLRQSLPQTYRLLLQHVPQIQADYSMAYGTINGFRASTARPYTWFDVERDQATDLTIYPAAWMDANSLFEQKLTPHEALLEAKALADSTLKTGGNFCTIAHNHFMGHLPPGPDWRNAYTQLWRTLTP